MKKNILFLTIIFTLMFSAAVRAESYEISADWMDLFFENDRDPWSVKKTEMTFLNNALKDFDCRNGVTNDGDYQMTCINKQGVFEGSYKITFSFGPKNDLVLDAVEIVTYHPRLKYNFDNFGDIQIVIENFKNKLFMKSYAKNYEHIVYGFNDYVHTIMTKNVNYEESFLTSKSSFSFGTSKDLLILNFTSPQYYWDHLYSEEADAQGNIKRVPIVKGSAP